MKYFLNPGFDIGRWLIGQYDPQNYRHMIWGGEALEMPVYKNQSNNLQQLKSRLTEEQIFQKLQRHFIERLYHCQVVAQFEHLL